MMAIMTKKMFGARLERPPGVGTWTYLNVPFNVADAFGTKGQLKVKGSVNGVPYRGSLRQAASGVVSIIQEPFLQGGEMHKRQLLIASLLIAALVLASCGGSATPAPGATSAASATSAPPAASGTVLFHSSQFSPVNE